jgi:poly(A) polymerase
MIYHYGKDFCRNKLLLQLAFEKKEIANLNELLNKIDTYEIPVFPLRGRDVISAGIAESTQIGGILKNLEKQWVDSNFTLSATQLLQKIVK